MFLEVKNLKKYYGNGDSQICVLNGVNFSVKKGELVVILGPSGSGKSTVLNLIGGDGGRWRNHCRWEIGKQR